MHLSGNHFVVFSVFYFYLDINECTQNTHACSQVCVNDLGSYHCDCYNGFLKQATTAIDVTCTGTYV